MTNATATLVAPGERVRLRLHAPALPSLTARVEAVAEFGLRLALEKTWHDWSRWAREASDHPRACDCSCRYLGRTISLMHDDCWTWREVEEAAGVGETGEVRIIMWEQIASMDVLA